MSRLLPNGAETLHRGHPEDETLFLIMSKYTGKISRVNAPSAAIAAKFDDLSTLEKYVENIPAEQRQKVGDLRFERDAIILKNPAIGEMALKVKERSDNRIRFAADGMLPLAVDVNLKPVDDKNTDINTDLDIDIPMMLRPMIGGKLQQVADMFGDLIAKLMSATV